MKITTSVKVPLTVLVDVDVEWDRMNRQATIVASRISDKNILTPRAVYAAMKPGDFHSLDTNTHAEIERAFEESCQEYTDKLPAELPGPGDEIRGAPVNATAWKRSIMNAYRSQATIPAQLLVDALKREVADIVLEPVLGRVPTVYIWNVDPTKDVLDEVAAKVAHIKSPQVERLEEGSLRLRW